MVVKTITVTEDAYNALKSLKEEHESFSKTILRVSRRKPLNAFFGILGKEGGAELRKNVAEMRKRRNAAHDARIKMIINTFERKE